MINVYAAHKWQLNNSATEGSQKNTWAPVTKDGMPKYNTVLIVKGIIQKNMNALVFLQRHIIET